MILNWKWIPHLLLILVVFISCQKEEVVDVTQKTELDRVVDSEFKRLLMPGLACLAVKDDSVVYLGLRGYANRDEKKAFTNQTRMLIASISKTVTMTAIMQLYEKGLVNLDTDINQYLPFQVRNPDYSEYPITVRMLLTHTSSISDAGYMPSIYYLFGYVDYPETLMSFEENYLTLAGSNYTKKNFSNSKPGEVYDYSNVGAALIACLVEHVTNTGFNDYCKQNIFEPLGMDKTAWFFSETPKNEIAIPYADNNITNPSKSFYSYPTYPDGHLITTIEDLSKFMRAFIMDGQYNDFQLLQPQTIDTIMHENISIAAGKQGLIFYEHKIGHFVVWGHDGGDPGVSTELYFDREKRVGYIMFNNRTEAYSTLIGNSLLLHANQY
ncbi:MAG: serine hydrolase [Bacteroidales bacterium]|nr:serine hydrolase [Bacteroidales bacterium]